MLKIITASLVLLLSCQQSPTDAKSHDHHPVRPGEKRFDIKKYKTMKFALPSGKLIEAFVADNNDRQTQGLSGVKDGELKDNQGMIFTYSATSAKQFWMPNTYMDLDIYFMDKKFQVIHVDRSVKAHPSLKEPVPRSSIIYAQNILEIPSSSPFAQEITKGMTLKLIR